MPPTYYQIEVSARWLTALLVALALLLVLAFAFGYGAAWSVLADRGAGAGSPGIRAAGAAPIPEQVILPTPSPIVPTAAPTVIPTAAPTTAPTQVPTSRPTATQPPSPTPAPTATSGPTMFWVQVVAVSDRKGLADARAKVGELGFPADHQQVAQARTAGGNVLYKLRVGPFPDRTSADRVSDRMRAAGFPDAWVVTP